jgi:phthiocerol/phenolphthiocerol synthesis type-I polyketide synthase E
VKASEGKHIRGAIAIVGMACRFPDANSPEAFWQNLCNGVESLRRLTEEELERSGVSAKTRQQPGYVPVYGGPEGVDCFDSAFFGTTPGEAECIDPQHRVLLECAHEALERSGFGFSTYKGRTGVFGGTGSLNYLVHNTRPWAANALDPIDGTLSREMQVMLGNMKSYVCTRISHRLDLRGPSLYVEAACATSLVAVHLACKSLLDYECDTAVAGASRLEVDVPAGYLYQDGGMTSPVGKCMAFDADAKGTVFANGAGAIVLKRLEDAIADGNIIHAVIRGSAVNNSGDDKVGFTAPSFEGQRTVILEAMSFADIGADSISYVESHGTGTVIGDPLEHSALTAAYRQHTDRRGYCALGTLKPNVGHMDAAAGIGGIIKMALAMSNQRIPPSINFNTPNPRIDFESSPFFVNTQLRDWDCGDSPRRGGVSAFGVGGTNAHVVMEEFIDDLERPARTEYVALPLSAKSEAALAQIESNLAEHLDSDASIDLSDAAFTLQHGREPHAWRSAVVANTREEAVSALRALGKTAHRRVEGSSGRAVTFLFPGQGSQAVRMAATLYREQPVFAAALDECAQLLRPHLGIDLLEVLYPSDAEMEAKSALLNETWITQPALFSVSWALAALWKSWGITPSAMLGHSVGEYVAACLAGVFELADVLHLIAARGRLMQAMPPGDMISVPLTEADVQQYLGDGIDLAAVNGPQSCVLSGPVAAIAALESRLQERSVDARRLRTSHAFHSGMMDPMLAAFEREFEGMTLSLPRIAYVSNVTGDWIRPEEATSPNYWARHLRGTVRFADGARLLASNRERVHLEVGPGATLTQFMRQLAGDRKPDAISSLGHPRQQLDSVQAMREAFAALWTHGVAVDWNLPGDQTTSRRIELPTYPLERKRYWIDYRPSEEQTRRPMTGVLPADEWYRIPVWKRTPPLAPAMFATPAQWLVFADRRGMAERVASVLAESGQRIVFARYGDDYAWSTDAASVTIRAGQAEDYARLLTDLDARGERPTRMLHAWCIDDVAGAVDLAYDIGFYSLLHLVQAIGSLPDAAEMQLNVLSTGLADISGEEPIDALKGAVLGPIRVVGYEQPAIVARHIDVPASGDARIAKQVLNELQAVARSGRSIAYRGVHRFELEHEQWDPALAQGADADPAFKQAGVYLITGGLGGLGLVFAEHLARHFHAGLVLTGRNGLPPSTEWSRWLSQHPQSDATSARIRTVQRLESMGAKVMVAAVDVTDETEMRALRTKIIERFGRIDGIMHAAGVSGGGIMQLKTREIAAPVLEPKVRGTHVLRKVFGEDALDLVVLHASLFGVIGGSGQVDYCGANASMDLAASDWSRTGVPVISIDWDGWTEVGMAARAGLFGASAEPMGEGHELSHPLLHKVWDHDDGSHEFMCRLHPDSHWIVDEHRIQGQPVVPGTSVLEMILAAWKHLRPTETAAIRDLLFLAPMAVDAEAGTQLRLKFVPEGDGFSLRVRCQSAQGQWDEGVMGTVMPASPAPATRDLDALRARCAAKTWDFTGRAREALPPGEWLSLRGRWESLRRVDAGHNEAMIDLELPAAYAGDLQHYAFHPALADLATGVANAVWLHADSDAPAQRFLPLGYQQLTMSAPLPAAFLAHVKAAEGRGEEDDTISLDIVLLDGRSGAVLGEVNGFSIRRVADASPQTVQETGAAAARGPAAADSEGIAPKQGVEALLRIVSANAPAQVMVSKRDFQRAMEHYATDTMKDMTGQWNDRPDIDSEYAAPTNEIEEALVEIWKELLGMNQIGIHDNFFDLGGDSLLVTQIPAKLRAKLNLGIELGTIFKGPTIAQIGEHLQVRKLVQNAHLTPVEAGEDREVGAI